MSLVLFCSTAALFWLACWNRFLDWDDQIYVQNQPQILNGIRWEGLIWAMTARVAENWHPLTLISLQFDAHVFGDGSFGFHLTAVLMHAANCVLAFHAIRNITGSFWRSAIVAVLFAWHPLRVESVAWVSERKDLLSGLFFWLTIIAYRAYAANPSPRRYLVVAIYLACGLCSKPMLVTTPCVLLLLDYWPLKRLTTSTDSRPFLCWNLIIEKLPLFALSAADALITVCYQSAALKDAVKYPLDHRIKNALISTVCYLSQTIWPIGLSPFYAHHEILNFTVFKAVALLVAITSVAIWQLKKRPFLLVGWLWFLGMLVPVCGIVQVGLQARADRYTYLPQVGIFLALVWGIADLVRNHRWAKMTLVGILCGFLIFCAFRTLQQIPIWHNTERMWSEAYRLDPDDTETIQKNLNRLRDNSRNRIR